METVPVGDINSNYLFDLFLRFIPEHPDERGFGSIEFDVHLAGSLAHHGWRPDQSLTDINGADPGGVTPVWAVNADTGASTNDLKDVVVSTADQITTTDPSDMRRFVGQPTGPTPHSPGEHVVNADGWLSTHIGSFTVYPTGVVYPDAGGPVGGYFGTITIELTGASYQQAGTGALIPDASATLVSPATFFIPRPDDGLYDLRDLNNVLNHFGQTGFSPGDLNADLVVDLMDLNRVLNNFGASPLSTASLTSVPEPVIPATLAAAVLLVSGRRRTA